jgi:hypothetical protein
LSGRVKRVMSNADPEPLGVHPNVRWNCNFWRLRLLGKISKRSFVMSARGNASVKNLRIKNSLRTGIPYSAGLKRSKIHRHIKTWKSSLVIYFSSSCCSNIWQHQSNHSSYISWRIGFSCDCGYHSFYSRALLVSWIIRLFHIIGSPSEQRRCIVQQPIDTTSCPAELTNSPSILQRHSLFTIGDYISRYPNLCRR